ncbi:Mur ligase family protein [Campylobacter concisus]|uniref:UDP-N-acetylmuramoylalanyl-D-glutamyl-2, 6-diaminopimelate--D-alanyl-D-alanine ligase n=1 Tax=Campylobacter concisus ATCC 51562 TaxID=1242969 RepID=U2GIA9_9BACT|nr:UDP-N-acetylmuramoyl-tripeptide--D-alanyl-D-alanine ligase [Campylobacter concisus]ERJ25723.1 UDP-N-acetylmuramoylalanyl-D-glutamyl-2,6-diaminopimelate--D-alanyl-D-alanine ligase [Campylobacter concisus ATCC 51562]
MNIFLSISTVLFIFALAFYVITCFQWFSYRPERVLFHFTKPAWHVFFFIVPLVLFYTTGKWFFIYFYFALLPALYLWHKKLDKKLVITGRIKHFFVILTCAIILNYALNFIIHNAFLAPMPLFVLVVSLFFSEILEKIKFQGFKNKALKKLGANKDLKIILITASYGKTSIKNFLFEILKDSFVCYKTPRSVNTMAGIIKDINENLSEQTQIYIAEAGARLKGDILEITKFLNPQIVIVGEIGAQHIEYFKTLDNIRATKLEALQSARLQMVFLHSSTKKEPSQNLEIYDESLKDINANLDGISFMLDGKNYASPLLGKFNATNLAVCIKVARYLKMSDEAVDRALSKMKNVEHRLSKIEAGGKLIIDDSFNGNFSGMSASYELVSTYAGRKVLLTPGIVESDAEQNANLAKVINEIFDLVIITSSLNAEVLLKHIVKPKIIILKDKNKMQEILAQNTRAGDLILFSNDAPSFI